MTHALLYDLSRTIARGDRECINMTARFVLAAQTLGYRARPVATTVEALRSDGQRETIGMDTQCGMDEWSGHMVAVIDEAILIDCTVRQFDGNRGIVTTDALAAPVPPAWLRGGKPLVVDGYFDWLQRITYTAVPEPADWPMSRSTWSGAQAWVRDHM